MKPDAKFLNYQEIVYSGSKKIIQVDGDSVAWGKQVLNRLDLEKLANFEKVQKINAFLSDEFAYNFGRSMRIGEIIQKKGGNCVSHTLMGIFLLRLAGIPAKFAHEVHLTKQYRLTSLYVGLWAKRNNSGINSFWHNDHVWIWFKEGEHWEPFDSALNLCGFDQFFAKRFFHHKELSEGFAQKWTGPPFVIWEGIGGGFEGMKTVTPEILNQETLAALEDKDDWLDLTHLFVKFDMDEFHKTYLPEELIRRIRRMSIRWFKT